jgi:RNA polymerase sigma factor (sigma-70 family)
MDDHVLLSDFAKSGKAEALGELVRRYEPLIRASAVRQVADIHLAQDITQTALMTLMRKASQIDPGTPLGPWLLRTTHYLATDALRSQSARRKHERFAAFARAKSSDFPTPRETAPALDDALNSLPEKYRVALVLCYLQGWTPPQIAEELGLTQEATRQRLSRAVRRLRDILQRRGLRMDDLTPAVFALPGSSGDLLIERLRAAARQSVRPIWKITPMKALTAVGAVAIVTGGIAVSMAALHRTPAPSSPKPPAQLMTVRANSTIP